MSELKEIQTLRHKGKNDGSLQGPKSHVRRDTPWQVYIISSGKRYVLAKLMTIEKARQWCADAARGKAGYWSLGMAKGLSEYLIDGPDGHHEVWKAPTQIVRTYRA